KNSQAALTLPNGVTAYNSAIANFSGDDALALQFTNGTNIDIFGVIGNDPGTSWTAGSLSTINQTLARDSDVLYGVSNNPTGTGTTAFTTLGTEWTGFPIDTVSNLGSHTMDFLPGSATIGSETENATVTYSGTVSLDSSAILTAASGGSTTFSGAISGTNGITKAGAGTVTLSAANTYSGGTTISAGVLAVGAGSTSGSISGAVTNNGTLQFNRSDSLAFSGAISGSGAVTKLGAGTLTLSGSGSYSGATTVSAGTLELADTVGGAAASTASVSVASGATLLLSQSDQVNNSASVTLSGGTITRGSGVSEVFGSLNLTTGSFLDFGTGDEGNLTFGTYQNNETPSALLTLNNFLPGNSLTFDSSSFSEGSINSYFTFGTGFVDYSLSNTGSTFTITAIPEPSTYLAAAGLLGLMLWPSRKRLLRDAKKILGLRAPMRDRLAARKI
ncbi:MAG: autotransporter-associated beta strand repeat-containing protein, partial [Chthoniobacterales bacterium]